MQEASTWEELPGLDEDSFERISELVYRHTGIRLGPGKGYFVTGRLAGLYRTLGCCHWGELPARFEANGLPGVREALVRAVVTSETSFFRDDAPFRALREKIAPETLAGAKGSPVPFRVWSAGCSTGQEPYSVVMAVWDLVRQGRVDLDVWATDISRAALERARQGVYEPFELGRGLDGLARREFFEDLAEGYAQVRKALRDRVRFEQVNLTESLRPARRFDVVLCRNVGIYFDREGKQKLYHRLGEAVKPGGYLVLGAAETLFPGVPGFETVYFARSLLFRKVSGGSP